MKDGGKWKPVASYGFKNLDDMAICKWSVL